jgi:D-alanyl-D-alanine carboxypeptidase (penicillin-binding protein 5/6)
MTPRTAARRPGTLLRRTFTPLLVVGALVMSSATVTAAAPDVPDPAPSPYTAPEPGPVIVKGQPGSTPLPDLKTDAFVLADATTGDILVERSLHNRMRPASTLKTLTMLSLIPRLKGDSPYVATDQDTSAEGSHVGMEAGSTYTVSDMFHGLALPSGNDAASGLANAYGGWDKTLALMNEEALRIGAEDTNAVNPSGLDQADQLTSVHDIAQVFRVGLTDPNFRNLVSTERYTFPGPDAAPGKPRESFEILTQDKLALHDYPGIIGGKTGYTTQAGRTFVVAGERDGHTLVAALFKIGGSTEETSKKLLDWGFANYGKVEPTGRLPELPDQNAEGIVAVPATNAHAAAGTEDELQRASSAALSQTQQGSSFLTVVGWLLVLLVVAIIALRIRARRRLAAARRLAATPPDPGSPDATAARQRDLAGRG